MQSGNKKLHGWEFACFTRLLEYKSEEHGILVDRVDEKNTSKTCSCSGQIRDANRVERGLYVCGSCEMRINADVNGVVNTRRKITQNPPTRDVGNGCLAQPESACSTQLRVRSTHKNRQTANPNVPTLGIPRFQADEDVHGWIVALRCVSRRRSIEATTQPDDHVPKLSFNGTGAVDPVVVAMEDATHHFWWFVLSCSPRHRRGEHVDLFEKLKEGVLKLRYRSVYAILNDVATEG